MKKTLSILLLSCLFGCGSGGGDSSDSGDSVTPAVSAGIPAAANAVLTPNSAVVNQNDGGPMNVGGIISPSAIGALTMSCSDSAGDLDRATITSTYGNGAPFVSPVTIPAACINGVVSWQGSNNTRLALYFPTYTANTFNIKLVLGDQVGNSSAPVTVAFTVGAR